MPLLQKKQPFQSRWHAKAWWIAPVGMMSLLVACGGSGDGANAPARPPVDVVIERIASAPAPNLIELSGRVEAGRSVQVRARTDGIVERQLFVEGTTVKEGAQLYEIDRRDLNSRQQQAKADQTAHAAGWTRR